MWSQRAGWIRRHALCAPFALAGPGDAAQVRGVNHSAAEKSAWQRIRAGNPLIIGHRGCAALAPENALPSFKLALAAGADLIELDYRHSRDGVPVVIHDATLDRTTDASKRWGAGRIRVDAKTAAEIHALDAGSWFGLKFAGAKVPLLTEALDLINGVGRVTLIERKAGDAKTCVELLRSKKLINRVIVIAFDWQFLRQLHELEPRLLLGALGPPTVLINGRKPGATRRRLRPCLNARWLDLLAPTGARLVAWNKRVAAASVKLAHERGLKIWVYTVDDPKSAIRLIDMGADGIITNDPALIRWTAMAAPQGICRT